MRGSRLSGLTLSVRDLQSQTSWYGDAFGLEQFTAFEMPAYRVTSVVLRSPEGWTLELLQRDDAEAGVREGHPLDTAKTLGYGYVTIEVDDLVAAFGSILENGATEIMGPHPGPSGFGAFVSDPEGNIIRLASRPGAQPDIPMPPGPPPGGQGGPPPGGRPPLPPRAAGDEAH